MKEASSTFADMKSNKEKLLKKFKNIKNIVNFNFLVCYTKLFNKNGIKNNIGCYLILSIILFHILTIIIFYLKQFLTIKKKINDIIFGINENKFNFIEENIIRKKKKLKIRKQNNRNINYTQSDKKEMIDPKKIKSNIINKKKKSKLLSNKKKFKSNKIIDNNIN